MCKYLLLFFFLFHFSSYNISASSPPKHKYYSISDTQALHITDSEWKRILAPEVYHITREKATEVPGSSPYNHSKAFGTYHCTVCGLSLFLSSSKFDSGCGWPSFFESIEQTHIEYKQDYSLGMSRIEIICARCDSHLGHVFDDGPPPTGLRYCLNGIALDFVAKY